MQFVCFPQKQYIHNFVWNLKNAFICLYNMTSVSSPSSPPSRSTPSPLCPHIYSASISFAGEQVSHGYQPAMVYQVED